MEILCAIHNYGENVENLWNLYGSFMEKILDWNMEKLWSICGELEYWKIVGWKIPKRATMEWYAKPTGRWKNVSENCRLDEHARGQGVHGWNYFRRGWNNHGAHIHVHLLCGNWIPC